MNFEELKIDELVPYKYNPRKNDSAVKIVQKSIEEYGFNVPILIDKDNVIIAGHTRFLASKNLGLKKVPVMRIEHLNERQVKAFRIMDNKSQEFSMWDYDLLKHEIFELKDDNWNPDLVGFTQEEINFFNPETDGPANDSYLEWRKSGGMDYGNEDKSAFKTILLHFTCEEDIESFAKLIKQTITNKTKYLWYPKQPEDKVADIKYVDI